MRPPTPPAALPLALLLLSAPGPAQASAPSEAALRGVADRVAGWVREGEVVGAELLVLQGGEVLLHEAHGWRDREAREALEPGALYQVRSMTKPFTGTLALLAAEAGELDLDRPVAAWLPEFDHGLARDITPRHLLTHTSGLPWLACMEGTSLRGMARCAGELGPQRFHPGTDFLYSNAGSNALAALVAEVGGAPLEALLAERVLLPLGLTDSAPANELTPAALERCVSRYVRETDGAWRADWKPADGAPLPFLQGAQGLVTTARDYARFLELWLARGELDGVRLLSPASVDAALRPAALTELPTRFPGWPHYEGLHWSLWTRGDVGPVAGFGHAGSDGTFAWAFPDNDLIVVYLTQCVNTPTGVELEVALAELLPEPETKEESGASQLEEYVGLYWNAERELPRVVDLDADGGLRVHVFETGRFDLAPTDEADRFEVPGRPGFHVRFVRGDDGAVSGFQPPESTGDSFAPRLPAQADLPGVAELMALRLGANGERHPRTIGPFRMTGHFLEGEERSWKDVLLSDGDRRSRESVHRSRRGPQVTVCNGESAQSISPSGRRRSLSGAQRELALLGRLAVLAGDWRDAFQRVAVVARVERDGAPRLLVRAEGRESPPVHYFVDPEDGRVHEVYTVVELPFGELAKWTRLSDHREVEGVRLPFRWEGRLAEESLGAWTLQYDEVETHVEVEADAFAIEP